MISLRAAVEAVFVAAADANSYHDGGRGDMPGTRHAAFNSP
jgi:hypothetical protein